MNDTVVYRWRPDPDAKRCLEDAAHAERTSVARLLDRIVRVWLARREAEDEARQQRIRAKAAKWIGPISLGQGPYTRERIRERVRTCLIEKRIHWRRDAPGSRLR